jgi:hypothetical protein
MPGKWCGKALLEQLQLLELQLKKQLSRYNCVKIWIFYLKIIVKIHVHRHMDT